MSIDPAAKPLLDLIGRLESNGNYNAVYGNANATHDLSQYSLKQIEQRQRIHGRVTGSSAYGKYQFIRKTLLGLRKPLGLSGNELFTPDLQDLLAMELLNRRGFKKWKRGKISDGAFLDSLSKEWASLPYRNGRSFYAGDSVGNRSLVSRKRVAAVLESVRRQLA